jgi:hypothetical protein
VQLICKRKMEEGLGLRYVVELFVPVERNTFVVSGNWVEGA